MADSTDRDITTPELDPISLASDGDVGLLKNPRPPLAFSPTLNRLALFVAVGLQFVILMAMIFGNAVPYIGAPKILLQVEPVDPRDLFRGDYVTLSYSFNRLPSGKYTVGNNVYVTLVPDPAGPDHYRPGEFLQSAPPSGLFLRGVAESMTRAKFGIESFYLQEGTGHDYEAAVRTQKLWAFVAVSAQGVPAIQRLVME